MKNKKLTLLCSIGLVLVLVLSTILAACAQEAAPAAPAAPAKPAPTTPTPAAPAPTTPTPAAPAPTTPAPAAPAPTTPAPAAPAPAPSAEVFDWKVAGAWPAGGAIHLYQLPAFKEYLENLSDGRIKLTLFAGGVLYPPKEAYEATLEGATELLFTAASYFRGKVPLAGCDEGQPMMWPDQQSIVYAHYSLGINEIKREGFDKVGIYYLGPMAGNEHGLMTVEKLINMGYFKNATIRTFGAYLDWYERLGMRTVYIPHDEVYMALKLGTINGYSTGRGEQWDWRGHEVCNYYYLPNVGYQFGQTFANMDAWNSLTPDLQKDVETSLQLLNLFSMSTWNPVWNTPAMTWFDNYGLEAVTLPLETQAFMYEKAQEVWIEGAAGDPESEEILGIIINYLDHRQAGTLNELELERLKERPLTGTP